MHLSLTYQHVASIFSNEADLKLGRRAYYTLREMLSYVLDFAQRDPTLLLEKVSLDADEYTKVQFQEAIQERDEQELGQVLLDTFIRRVATTLSNHVDSPYVTIDEMSRVKEFDEILNGYLDSARPEEVRVVVDDRSDIFTVDDDLLLGLALAATLFPDSLIFYLDPRGDNYAISSETLIAESPTYLVQEGTQPSKEFLVTLVRDSKVLRAQFDSYSFMRGVLSVSQWLNSPPLYRDLFLVSGGNLVPYRVTQSQL
jgi:hypothetical protein